MTRQARPLTRRDATWLGVAASVLVIAPHATGVLAADPMVEGHVVELTTMPHPPIPRMCLVWPDQPCPEPQPMSTIVVVALTDGTTVTREEPASVAAGCTTGSTVRYDTGCGAGR
jgi:hypothetical protein